MEKPEEKKIRIETLVADRPFEVEIAGPSNTDVAVVMVHGFGVKRDSRGLFTDLEAQVAGSMLSIRGDFSEIRGTSTRAIPVTQQVERLDRVLSFTHENFNPKKLVYVGHSQGCIVIAKKHPTDSTVILLAPPILPPYEQFIQTPGWGRPGSHLDTEGESRLMRSDGSVTEVGADFWQDFRTVDPKALYTELAARNQTLMVFAGADQVLGQQNTLPGIPSILIPEANHDFAGTARSELLRTLSRYMGSRQI